jgi:hypothetical protein
MEYDKCDEQHIIGMLAAEKKTCKIKLTAWSPKFSKAVEDEAFWKIALSLRRSYTRPNDKFYRWAMTRGIEDFSTIDTKTILKNLRSPTEPTRYKATSESTKRSTFKGIAPNYTRIGRQQTT